MIDHETMAARPVPDDGALETIQLLHDEIARLEEELRLRDEALAAAARVEADCAAPAAPFGTVVAEAAARQIETLSAEVAERDQTIAELFDHVRRLEEAEAAGRADWEQLQHWVEQVEQRIDLLDRTEEGLAQELAAERHKAEALRRDAETERRVAATRSHELAQENARLRAQLADLAGRNDDGALAALAMLEHENAQLRRRSQELERCAGAWSEVEGLRSQVEALQAELDATRQELRRTQHERDELRHEHEAAQAELRGQRVVIPVPLPSEAPRTDLPTGPLVRRPQTASNPAAQLSADERIRALRLHLQEIHQREQEERDRRRLVARLSRLWNRMSTPKGPDAT
jgi:myosin heavy subunit